MNVTKFQNLPYPFDDATFSEQMIHKKATPKNRKKYVWQDIEHRTHLTTNEKVHTIFNRCRILFSTNDYY